MEKKNQVAVASQTRYLLNISNPISKEFKMDVMKMNTQGLVKFVLEDKPTSIHKLHKEDSEKTIDTIMLMLIQFQDFYNCKSKMNKSQLEDTAMYIISQLRHLNYYDIALCLKYARLTEKIYDRIDGGMILEWLTKHDIERTGLIVQEREKQKAQNNAEWSALGERTSEMTIKNFLKKES